MSPKCLPSSFGSVWLTMGSDGVWRFKRWPPWPPSWISERNDFRNSESLCCSDAVTIMICGTGLDLLQSSGELPCAFCRTWVGSNSIFCNSCKHWVHKKCSGLKRLTKDPDYRCMSFGRQTTEGSPSGTWPVGVRSSFLLLPWRHALSSWRLWTFNHNTCKPPRRSTRSCYQFSLPTTALSRHIASWTACVQSAMLHAS